MSGTDGNRPALVLVVASGPQVARLLESVTRFNRDEIPVVTEPSELPSVVIPSETVFVRDFSYSDFLDGGGNPRVFWTHDGDRRAAGTVEAGNYPPTSWEEPIFLDLRGLPVAYSLRNATDADIARGYVGYIGDLPTSPDPLSILPVRQLVRAALLSAYSKAPRLQRLVDRLHS